MNLIGFLARHRVAPNLLMLMMVLGGLFAIDRLNIQFFPNFALDFINVNVKWTGASADDIEHDVVVPLEQSLKNVDHLRELASTSTRGSTTISLELKEGTAIEVALNQVKQKVDEFRNLPSEAETPRVFNVVRYERIAHVLITGTKNKSELRSLANRCKQELVALGIDKVDINGLADDEITIEIPSWRLKQLGMSLDQVGQRISEQSRNIPAGTFGYEENAREVRGIEQRRDESGFAGLEIYSDNRSRIELGSVAKIKRQPRVDGVTLTVDGNPAVELVLRRAEGGDTLESAEILEAWLEKTEATIPNTIKLQVYQERAQPIKDRIGILLKNGTGGLVLVIAVLFLFLNTRAAFWVAAGIPVSFMAALLIVYFAGGSINMISLFALIMTLGIIVDDAIVVGEDAYSNFQSGETALQSVVGGATRMLAPVTASSLTTIAAFFPIVLISGTMGNIMFDIPLVVIAVILASLFECFLVLPGHLRAAFADAAKNPSSTFRLRFDRAFDHFKNHWFRRLLGKALSRRAITLSIAFAGLIFIVGLFAGGRVGFVFFPSPETSIIHASVIFSPGTPREMVDQFLEHLERTVRQVDGETTDQQLIETLLVRHGADETRGTVVGAGESNLGSLSLELVDSDSREIRNERFIESWRQKIKYPAGLQTLTIAAQETAPDSNLITIRLTGATSERVKNAAMALQNILHAQPHVFDATDNMPYGKEQLIYKVTPAGTALGLTTAELGRQLRTAFDGRLIQIYQDGPDEVEVRIRLPESERNYLNVFEKMEIYLESGEAVPFRTVAELSTKTGFASIRHADGEIAVDVTASLPRAGAKIEVLKDALMRTILPEIAREFGVRYRFAGRTSDQANTIDELKLGVYLALALVYLVLAWIFSSYGWPLVVMSIIPFGVVGAVIGHFVTGLDVTLMSLLGFFGLSGIVVNDSIILVIFYRQLIEQGVEGRAALVEASVRRIRAVLLTSLTTIVGLIPLLFETSVQAQFLLPMAVSIAFGLTFSTLIVLILVPVMLSIHEDIHAWVFARA